MRTYLYKLTMYVKVSAHNEEEAEELVLDNYKDFTELHLQGHGEMEKVDESADY